ncbi:C1 family peptidase [uncultured Clostridium sp.]|jgi:bleomycin hydrolase|uniref:C1 family peptidase n=1 Tax=uncultured Clostridium sp. TaxID=59620 RepID=UPI002636FBCD|nr:C1 family peptidase [uncultured Clostridium sp.]
MMEREININDIKKYHEKLKEVPNSKIIKNAVMNNGINDTCKNNKVIAKKLARNFSIEIKTGEVSNQKQSGRCWLFATLNTLRHDFAVKHNVKNFEFSQNYLSFWDRFEKANAFYNFVIETANEPLDSRIVNFLFKNCNEDGGQWDNSAALIKKYGMVPKYAMPETKASEGTKEFTQILGLKLRKDGMNLRAMIEDGQASESIDKTVRKMLNEVYRMCAYAFGEPPHKFDLEFRNEADEYIQDLEITPKDFYEKYIGRDLDEYVVIINAPDKEFNKTYCIPFEKNVIGGQDVSFLNLDLKEFKEVLLNQIKDKEVTWFGADVLQGMSRDEGFLESKLFDYKGLFDVNFKMSKTDRLRYFEAVTAHAMTITGVNLVDGEPNRWKVENSWGEKPGDKGYFVMSDRWLNDYVYHIVINKKYLTKEQLEMLNAEKIKLTPWDSMG